MKKIIKRELEVALSKHSQPIWFRILKYIVLGLLIYTLWGTNIRWIVLAVLLAVSLSVLVWYREKTNALTIAYGVWE